MAVSPAATTPLDKVAGVCGTLGAPDGVAVLFTTLGASSPSRRLSFTVFVGGFQDLDLALTGLVEHFGVAQEAIRSIRLPSTLAIGSVVSRTFSCPGRRSHSSGLALRAEHTRWSTGLVNAAIIEKLVALVNVASLRVLTFVNNSVNGGCSSVVTLELLKKTSFDLVEEVMLVVGLALLNN